ncbi:MAG: hypothetical protein ACTSU8_01455 [Alphaproteobacteria bacterium]
MQRAKAGFAIIFLIAGAMIFAALMEDTLSEKFSPAPVSEEKPPAGSE